MIILNNVCTFNISPTSHILIYLQGIKRLLLLNYIYKMSVINSYKEHSSLSGGELFSIMSIHSPHQHQRI